jgi:diguanylate cyclase (GGDEF)-like protein
VPPPGGTDALAVESLDSPVAAVGARPTGPADAGGWRARAWWWALAGCALLILAYPLLPDTGRLVVYRLLGALAVAGVLGGARLHGLPLRGPWLLLGLGLAAFAIGDVLRDLDGAPSVAGPRETGTDALYLAGYPLLVAGLALLGQRRTAGRDPAGRLDALIVAIGAGLVVWVFVLAPYATRETLASAAGLKAVLYPVGDLLLLGLAVRLFLVAGPRPRAQWLLGLGLFAVLCGDALYLAAATGGGAGISPLAMQLAWLSSYALLGAAVLDPTIRRVADPEPFEGRGHGRLWVLAGASLLAPATLAVETLATTTSHALLIAATSGVLFALVVLRMAGLMRQVEAQATELARIARTDALTGVPNRRAWDEQLAVELARAARAQDAVCVALLDLDHFKAFNDREGHPAGDALLRAAATAWRRELRSIDVLARYGGEEFGLILPGCTVSEGAAIVDRLRELTPLGETSSAGVAAWDGVESAYALVARADRALYGAKRSGRDRTVLAPGPQALAA